jgi:hypothetical protein
MHHNIVLLHTGPNFPTYINDTIKILQKTNNNIHLITEKKFFQFIDSNRVVLVDADTLIEKDFSQYQLLNHDPSFMGGFFPRTSSRFILINSYITKNDLNNVFHIENDIALFSDLSIENNYLFLSPYDTALIIDHNTRCIPSVVWYRNKIASKKLSKHIILNNTVDDMKNLAKYFHQNRSSVTNLPIVPYDIIDLKYDINYGNHFKKINSIFDGAAIGQYLFGIDPIHSKNCTKGFINETSVINASTLSIFFEDKKPYIDLNGKKITINNLHMHCKNLEQLL